MRRAKLLAATLLLFAIMLSLSGCHGSKGLEPFTMPEDADSDREYEISFWAKNDTNKTQTRIYEKAIASFEELYPNVKVKLRLYTNYGKIYNDVITNIATNTTPNVCITYPDHIATYLSGSNTVVPLDELIADRRYGLGGSDVAFDCPKAEELIPGFLDECAFQGHYYALPFMRSTEAVYINKTFVEAMGYTLPEVLTWDFIWEVADAATQKNADGSFAVNGQQVMIPFIYKSTDNMMIQMLRQKNAGYSNADGEIFIFNDSTKQLLLSIAQHVEKGSFSTFKISSYPANFLNAGQCIFAIDSTAGATWMGSNAPLMDISPDKFVDFETEVMAVPQFDADAPQMISQGPSVCIFNKADPQEVLYSWLFVQYLLTNEVQIPYSQTEGYIPVTTKALNSSEYQDYLDRGGEDNELYYNVKIEASKLLLDNIHNTFVTPVFNGSASLRDASGQMIENVTKSVKRGETVDNEYIDRLYEEISALYRLDQLGGTNQLSSENADLGPLPTASVVLLVTLGTVWALIIVYWIHLTLKKKRSQ